MEIETFCANGGGMMLLDEFYRLLGRCLVFVSHTGYDRVLVGRMLRRLRLANREMANASWRYVRYGGDR